MNATFDLTPQWGNVWAYLQQVKQVDPKSFQKVMKSIGQEDEIKLKLAAGVISEEVALQLLGQAGAI